MQVYSNKGREFGMQTKVKKQKMKSSLGDKIFVIINTVILLCMCFVTLYPIWYVLCIHDIEYLSGISSRYYAVAA